MPRYMIELPFPAQTCDEVIPKLSQREVDFLPQVFWGCAVSAQKGWAIVEADSTEQAKGMVPEALREKVWITEVKTLTPELIEAKRRGEIEKAA